MKLLVHLSPIANETLKGPDPQFAIFKINSIIDNRKNDAIF